MLLIIYMFIYIYICIHDTHMQAIESCVKFADQYVQDRFLNKYMKESERNTKNKGA